MIDGVFQIVPCGDDALRILCGTGGVRYQLARHLLGFGDWPEIVPGKEDVTVLVDLHISSLSVAFEMLKAQLSALPAGEDLLGQLHILPAIFGGVDGPDLEFVALSNGVSAATLIDTISQAQFEVDLIGFTPGFSYLSGLPARLQAERLATPRVRVPAGSIGIITGQAGLYALEGPGGWPIVGRVTDRLFDPFSDKPFRLMPGDRVRIIPETSR